MPKAIRIAALLLLTIAVVLVITAINLGRRTSATSTPVSHDATAAPKPQLIAVAAQSALPAGHLLSAGDLLTTPLDQSRSGSFKHPAELAGAVLARDLQAGEVITRDMLLQGIATQLRAGERALAIPVDELIGVGNRIAPGDYVDVFMSLREPDSSDTARKDNTQARLLLSRLRVLGYGSRDLTATSEQEQSDQIEPGAEQDKDSRAATIAADSGGGSNTQTGEVAARTAVLAVPIEQAGRLLLGAHSGKLYLALRNPGDQAIADETAFASPASVLGLRRDLDPTARAMAMTPENQAYAGIDLLALAGKNLQQGTTVGTSAVTPQRPARRSPARSPNQVEIIRGAAPAAPLSSP